MLPREREVLLRKRGIPPGLGFVWFSNKAKERCTSGDLRTPYWDWGPRANPDSFYGISAAPRRPTIFYELGLFRF